jgi:Crinkler effector protein N-terminal domain
MSDSNEIKLWCWVLGDPSDRVFSVSIRRDVTIEKLKEVIQIRKSSFKDIAADSLTVFKVGGWYR